MLTRFVRPRVLVAMGVVTGCVLTAVSVGLATTATGSQNPDLTVTVTLASRGTPDPEFATVGDTVDALLAVRNNKNWTFPPRLEEVRVRLILGIPTGQSVDASVTLHLLPGQTVRLPFDYRVNEFFPKGLYSLTLEASEVNDPTAPVSSATATLTII